jgi:hypothetical protein
MMLYEDGVLYSYERGDEVIKVVVWEFEALAEHQKLEYERSVRWLNGATAPQVKDVIATGLRIIAAQIRASRLVDRERLVDLEQELPIALSINEKNVVRQSLAELQEIEDLDRLKEYLLKIVILSYQVVELMKKTLVEGVSQGHSSSSE